MTLVTDSRFWLVALLGGLFMLGLRFPRVQFFDPFVFLLIAMIPLSETPESVTGFGIFAVGAILLFVDGRLSKRPVLKLVCLGLYLFLLVIGSTILNNSTFENATGLLIFMTTFFLFLFLTFQDKIIVFVKAAKPVVKLQERGLSSKETEHLLALLEGKSMKEIAWAQGVKESTVRNSLSRTYRKLGFTDKTQLLQWAENYEIRA